MLDEPEAGAPGVGHEMLHRNRARDVLRAGRCEWLLPALMLAVRAKPLLLTERHQRLGVRRVIDDDEVPTLQHISTLGEPVGGGGGHRKPRSGRNGDAGRDLVGGGSDLGGGGHGHLDEAGLPEPDSHLGPGVSGALDDPERQVVEQLVRHDEPGEALREDLEARLHPHAREIAEVLARAGATFDRDVLHRHVGPQPGEELGGERAIPGPELDQVERVRVAQVAPGSFDGTTEQRPEHRVHVRAGYEVAASPPTGDCS